MISAIPLPIRAVINWGQENMVLNIATCLSASSRTLHSIWTISKFNTKNFAAEAETQAKILREEERSALHIAKITITRAQLPAAMAGVNGKSCGPMPRMKAKRGLRMATVSPLLKPDASAATARTALTQDPVTI